MAKILINATSGLGQNLMAVPFIRALPGAFDRARITAVVRFEPGRDLLMRMTRVEKVLVLGDPKYRGIRGAFRLVRELRQAEFDYCFNLVPANKGAKNLLARLSGARVVVGHRYDYGPLRNLSFLVNQSAPVDHERHDVEQNFVLLEAAGLKLHEPPDLSISFPIHPEEHEFAAQWLQQRGLIRHPPVALHPGSSGELGMDAKRWPAESYGELARGLARDPGLAPLIIAGPDERNLAYEVAQLAGGPVCTNVTVGQLAAILSRCGLVVSNDSFPMHLAAATAVPVVGIFGPTDPIRTRPWTEAGKVVRLVLPCSPCWNVKNIGQPFHCTNPDHFACLRKLAVDQVLDACRRVYRKWRRG